MKTTKKIFAILLAVMMLAVCTAAWATGADLTDGEIGGFVDYDSTSPDNTAENSKLDNLSTTVNIVKEIIALNANASEVNAPVITYTYTVTPASITGNPTVTDDTTDHASGTAVTAPVKEGITTGLVVTGTAAGTAGDSSSAVGTLVFTNANTFTTAADASTATATNSYNISLNFADVDFPQAGVYRYQIAETTNPATISTVGMEGGTSKTRYLDVYVDGSGDIYGYVCIDANSSVTSATEKTNGFVAASDGADTYYTYDLTISKTVVNDTYAQNNVAFPFTVIFRNSESLVNTYTITETAAQGSTGISPTAATAPTWSGVALVKHGAAITYTGIPAGVDVDVYETNNVSGVTYTVSTSVNDGAAVVDNNVTSGDTPNSAVAQTTAAAYQSTKATVDTTLITAVDAPQTIAITNTLQTISPTGLVLRFAPYALILVGGIALLFIAMKHKKHTDEE